MNCPDCKSAGFITGMGCPGFKMINLKCPRCEGLGTVSDEQAQWIEEGKKIRAFRHKRDLSLREAASALLIQPTYLSAIERGCARAEGPIRKLLDEA
jgi:phage FluMu protein Com